MKKLMFAIIVTLLIGLLVACGGNGNDATPDQAFEVRTFDNVSFATMTNWEITESENFIDIIIHDGDAVFRLFRSDRFGDVPNLIDDVIDMAMTRAGINALMDALAGEDLDGPISIGDLHESYQVLVFTYTFPAISQFGATYLLADDTTVVTVHIRFRDEAEYLTDLQQQADYFLSSIEILD